MSKIFCVNCHAMVSAVGTIAQAVAQFGPECPWCSASVTNNGVRKDPALDASRVANAQKLGGKPEDNHTFSTEVPE